MDNQGKQEVAHFPQEFQRQYASSLEFTFFVVSKEKESGSI